jgi:hypothetical protein
MGAILSQTDLHGTSSAAIELLKDAKIRRGILDMDLHQSDLTHVAIDRNGRPRVDGREVEALAVVTPEDETGWCTTYAANYTSCESMVLDLAGPCPLATDVRSWAAYLGIEEAVYGTYSEQTNAWQWTRYWWGRYETFRFTVGQPAPGYTLQHVFGQVGRVFHGQTLERFLGRALLVEAFGSLAGHTLLWTKPGQRRRSMNG